MNTDVQEEACTFVGNTEIHRRIRMDMGRQRIRSDSDGAVSLRRCVQLNLWLNIQSLWRGVAVLVQIGGTILGDTSFDQIWMDLHFIFRYLIVEIWILYLDIFLWFLIFQSSFIF